MKLYLAVSTDKYELPLYVADSAKELARAFHTTENSVYSSISKNSSGRNKKAKFLRVEVSE